MYSMRRQHGLSLFAWLILIALAAFLAVVALKLIPIYLKSFEVAKTLDAVAQEPGIKKENKRIIWSKINKRLDVSYVDFVKPEHFSVEVKKGKTTLILQWEVREHLFGNLDVVATFDKRAEVR
jgi:Tfp pilus assembly major pilin PilA